MGIFEATNLVYFSESDETFVYRCKATAREGNRENCLTCAFMPAGFKPTVPDCAFLNLQPG
jgi:hypothetical protein